MKNLLRQAQRELKSLQKKQTQFDGSGEIKVYIDFSIPEEIILAGGTIIPPDDEPGKMMLLTTIKGVPKGIYQSIMSKFGGK